MRHSAGMWRHPFLTVALLAYIGWGGWNWFTNRAFHPPDGVLAAGDPTQSDVLGGEKIQLGHWTLTVRANYRITARILARERYHFDTLSDLVPEDLALGWGPMSDNRILRSLDIYQADRFYFWRASAHPSIQRDSIIAHSARTTEPIDRPSARAAAAGPSGDAVGRARGRIARRRRLDQDLADTQ